MTSILTFANRLISSYWATNHHFSSIICRFKLNFLIWVNFWQNFFFWINKIFVGNHRCAHFSFKWLLSWNLFVWEFWSNRFFHRSMTTHIANIVLTAIKVESAPSHNYVYRIKYSENIPRTLLDLISHRSLYFGYFTMCTSVFFSSCFRKYLIAFSESS